MDAGVNARHRDQCVEEASYAGAKGAALGISLSAPLVYAAHRFSPTFRRFTASAKTGLVVTPFFGLFFLNSELTMNACAQRRNQFAEVIAPK
jgi:hypothetical protein